MSICGVYAQGNMYQQRDLVDHLHHQEVKDHANIGLAYAQHISKTVIPCGEQRR